MTLFVCRRCGVLLNKNSRPRECPACERSTGIEKSDTPIFRPIRDPDELFE